MKLKEIKPKMRVAYVPAHAAWDKSAIEHGTVSSINERFAFVKFDKQLAKFGWDYTTSKACDPKLIIKLCDGLTAQAELLKSVLPD